VWQKKIISGEKQTGGNNSKINTDTISAKITVLDIERENRLSKVTSLYSKGLNQEEIALELHVDQSTVSRDLQLIKQEARRQVDFLTTMPNGFFICPSRTEVGPYDKLLFEVLLS
jgi:DNA-directed RNA polymerase specialized sigma subunit